MGISEDVESNLPGNTRIELSQGNKGIWNGKRINSVNISLWKNTLTKLSIMDSPSFGTNG